MRQRCDSTDITAGSVSITGAGLVSCLGLNREANWEAVARGRSGIAPLTAVESPLSPNKGGGQAPDLCAPPVDETHREVAYLNLAIGEALRDAGVLGALPYSTWRCGFLLGTTLHGMRHGGRHLRSGDLEPLASLPAGSTLRRAAGEFGLEGMATTVCAACSSGLSSIAMAVTLLRNHELDLVVSGGYDTISEYAYGGFNGMRLMAEGSVHPFARDRDGLKLGEGYGIVVLERAVDARRRGATVLANMVGFGESCDAYHLSQPHPEGEGATRAMSAALTAAAVSPGDIDLIAAHATATPNNDAAEFAAMSRVFGHKLRCIPVVAFKTHLAHTLGGAGAAELILTAMALREQAVPPCAHATETKVEFDGLRLATGEAVGTPLGHSLNTSLGFGGANTCVVLARADGSQSQRDWGQGCDSSHIDAPRGLPADRDCTTPAARQEPRPPNGSVARAHRAPDLEASASRDVLITGIGVIFPGVVGNDAFKAHLARDRAKGITEDTGGLTQAGGLGGLDIAHLLQARRVRRMSEYAKLSLAATTLAYRDAGIDDIASFGEACSAVLGTMHGSSNYCERYYRQLVEEGIAAANPILFAEGVPNAGGAHLSTMLSIKGLCQTVIGTRTAGLDAIRLATARIRSGLWERAVVSVTDEYAPLVNRAYAHFGLHRSAGAGPANGEADLWGAGFVTGCGAVTLILESRTAAARRSADGARARGVVQATASAFSPVLATCGGVTLLSGVVTRIGQPSHVMGSANHTWLDRIEGAAFRRAALRRGAFRRTALRRGAFRGVAFGRVPAPTSLPRPSGSGPIVSSIYGHIAECFSVLPLAGLAAVLLSGRMPTCLTPCVRGVRAARGDERPDSLGVLCTDYNGMISGVRIGLAQPITDSPTP